MPLAWTGTERRTTRGGRASPATGTLNQLPPRHRIDDPMRNTPESGAIFSPCERYRYALWRQWKGPMATRPGYVAFVGLNPSTADEVENDPTVRRCINFAMRWGYGAMVMLNAFGWRATDPANMRAADDPVGDDNDFAITRFAGSADKVVVAWGNHGIYKGRGATVASMLWVILHDEFGNSGMECFGVNECGEPKHPLYLRADRPLEPYAWHPDRVTTDPSL